MLCDGRGPSQSSKQAEPSSLVGFRFSLPSSRNHVHHGLCLDAVHGLQLPFLLPPVCCGVFLQVLHGQVAKTLLHSANREIVDIIGGLRNLVLCSKVGDANLHADVLDKVRGTHGFSGQWALLVALEPLKNGGTLKCMASAVDDRMNKEFVCDGTKVGVGDLDHVFDTGRRVFRGSA